MTFPRVLIFGQPFNNKYGGGITLTNLFKGWDKDKIAVAATGHMMYGVTTDVCSNYYQLGIDEFRWRFPFNLLQRKFKSGMIACGSDSKPQKKQNKLGIRYFLVNNLFYPFLEWLGLFHSISMIKMSPGFINWLSQFNPDILYLQVSTRDSLIFTQKLIKYLSVPSAIHVMDDWPSTISERGLFRKFWKRKIDGEFRELLAKADLCLSISDAMSDEYYRRYNKYFKPFHNPIEMGRFMQSNQVRTNTPDVFRILYLGRIGFANRNSIFNFAKVISEIKTDKFRITLDIFTSDNDTPFVRKISSIDKTTVNPAVKYDDVPLLLKAFDLLLLPLDFTEDGLKYAQYSIPTKASEYMISGTPVLVYAPGETAISKFCRENECAHCVTEEGDEYIKKAIQLLVSDENYRNKISNKAVKLAGELFDAKKVRKDFQNLLIRLSEREDSIKPGN